MQLALAISTTTKYQNLKQLYQMGTLPANPIINFVPNMCCIVQICKTAALEIDTEGNKALASMPG